MKYAIHKEVVDQVDRLLDTIHVASRRHYNLVVADVIEEAEKLRLLMEKHVYRPKRRKHERVNDLSGL